MSAKSSFYKSKYSVDLPEVADASLVDEEEYGCNTNEENGVLDTIRNKVDVASQASHLEDIDDLVGHDIGTAQLLPRPDRGAAESTSPHAVLEEAPPASHALSLSSKNSRDLVPFDHHQWVVQIPASLNVGEDLDSFLLPSDLRQPSGPTRQEGDTEHKEDGWDELDGPSGPERGRGRGIEEAASVANEVHDEDPPLDGPLLDNDDRAADFLLGDLGEVDGDLRGSDSDADAVDEAASNEHSHAGGACLDGSSS